MKTTNLPHRFSEKSFRKYEPFIRLATSNYPKPLTLEIEGSLETFSCRLRDAMHSLFHHNWDTDIDIVKFTSLYKLKQLIVSIQGNNIILGKKSKTTPINFKLKEPAAKAFPEAYKDIDEDTLKALITLITKGLHPRIIISTPSNELINLTKSLSANHDIGWFFDEQDNQLVIS